MDNLCRRKMDKEMKPLFLLLSIFLCVSAHAREPQPATHSGTLPPRSTSTQKVVRARDLGVPFEGIAGPLNAITDVAGVEIGYTTLIRGEGKLEVGKGPVRT